MGLMQIMPETWATLRLRYSLGADPFDPHDNILAGAAYLRELHDRYGSPGFLAAYNAGPARYEDHLATGQPLPAETRAYVALLAPLIGTGAIDDNAMVAIAARSWTEAPLFTVRADGQTAGRSAGRRAARRSPFDRHRRAGFDGARPAVGRPVCAEIPPESAAMREIGLHRGVAGSGTGLGVRQGEQGNTTNGRQGKRLALRAAQVVGWIEEFKRPITAPCWRSRHFLQGFQRFDRPSLPIPASVAAMSTSDDDIQVRPGPHPPWQPGRQAAADPSLARSCGPRRRPGMSAPASVPARAAAARGSDAAAGRRSRSGSARTPGAW